MHICLEDSSHDPKFQAIKISSWKCSYLFMHFLYIHLFAFIHIIFSSIYVIGTSQVSGNRQALLTDTALPHRAWLRENQQGRRTKWNNQIKSTIVMSERKNTVSLKSGREKPSLGWHLYWLQHRAWVPLYSKVSWESHWSRTWPRLVAQHICASVPWAHFFICIFNTFVKLITMFEDQYDLQYLQNVKRKRKWIKNKPT